MRGEPEFFSELAAKIGDILKKTGGEVVLWLQSYQHAMPAVLKFPTIDAWEE